MTSPAHGAGGAALPGRARHARELLQESLHPAHQAVPGRLPLLHVRARAARGASRTTSRPRRCWTSRAGARRPAARRRCSRWATSRNCATRRRARRLRALGAESTLDYLEGSAALVLKETGLLPHLNPGVMDEAWLARLRKVSVSQGIMLETASERLSRARRPALRLARQAAGRAARHAGGRRARARAVHHRHSDRHRRDARGAHRGAAGDPRAARALRPHPGGDHPEFPRQARHAHGARRGADARRSTLWTIAVARLVLRAGA